MQACCIPGHAGLRSTLQWRTDSLLQRPPPEAYQITTCMRMRPPTVLKLLRGVGMTQTASALIVPCGALQNFQLVICEVEQISQSKVVEGLPAIFSRQWKIILCHFPSMRVLPWDIGAHFSKSILDFGFCLRIRKAGSLRMTSKHSHWLATSSMATVRIMLR